MESNGRDQLDSMLDDALAVYSAAEPLAGLEKRVLQRLRAAEATSHRPPRWTLAFAAAAALVLVAIVMRGPRNPAPKTEGVARVEIPAPLRPAAAVDRPRVTPKHDRGRIAARLSPSPELLPKQEQFPAPAPLTAEERVLRSFVEGHPAEAQQVFAQLQRRSNEPIQIEPIQIAPLLINGAQ
jgi:hypothetical protein